MDGEQVPDGFFPAPGHKNWPAAIIFPGNDLPGCTIKIQEPEPPYLVLWKTRTEMNNCRQTIFRNPAGPGGS